MLCARKTQCGLYTPHRNIPTQSLIISRALDMLGRNRVTMIASRRLPHVACTVRVVDGPMAPSSISGGATSVASRRYSFGFVRWGQLVASRLLSGVRQVRPELCVAGNWHGPIGGYAAHVDGRLLQILKSLEGVICHEDQPPSLSRDGTFPIDLAVPTYYRPWCIVPCERETEKTNCCWFSALKT